MAGILSFLQAAIQPAAAARAGYMQGQEQEKDKQRAQGIQDVAIKRQGILDQIRANLDTSEIDKNNALAQKARRAPNAPASHYRETVGDDGTVYSVNENDPTDIRPMMVNGKPVKRRQPPDPVATHQADRDYDVNHPLPTRESPDAADARELTKAKTAFEVLKEAIPRPSKVPKMIPGSASEFQTALADPKNAGSEAAAKAAIAKPNPAYAQAVTDSTNFDRDQLQPARQRVIDLAVGNRVKLGTTAPPTASASPGPSPYSLSANTSAKAMQGEFDEAATKYKTLLSRGVDPATAQRAYSKTLATITQKYGVADPSGATGTP